MPQEGAAGALCPVPRAGWAQGPEPADLGLPESCLAPVVHGASAAQVCGSLSGVLPETEIILTTLQRQTGVHC